MTSWSPEPNHRQRLEAMSNFLPQSLQGALNLSSTASDVSRALEFHDRMCAFGSALSSPAISPEQVRLTLETVALIQHGTSQMTETLSGQSDTIAAMAAKIERLESECRELRDSLRTLRQLAIDTSGFVCGSQSDQIDTLKTDIKHLWADVQRLKAERRPDDPPKETEDSATE